MDMNYGCDVSNRYMGYLDDSDHGNPMTSSAAKNKRKTKKKRKPKNQKIIEKTTSTAESDVPAQNVEITTQIIEVVENKQSLSSGHKSGTDEDSEAINHEITIESSGCPTSIQSFDSLAPSETLSQDGTKASDDGKEANQKGIPQSTKWSDMCLEEEKLLSMESEPTRKVDEQKMMSAGPIPAEDKRIYPTIYIYNSNFGNKNCRSYVYTDWHDLNRRFNNEDDNDGNADTKENKKIRGYRHGRSQKKFTAKSEQGDLSEKRSGDEIHNNSRNVSNDRAPQQLAESNHRENINSKHRNNKFTHGNMPQRTFTRRRPQDFVRNV